MAGVVQVGATLLDGGVQTVSWWNGRILTAEDLTDAQDATGEGLRRLGRAVGDGVANGLMVSGAVGGSTVSVTPGAAVDRAGEVLVLPGPDPLEVSLTAGADEPTAGGEVGFVACADAPAVRSASGLGAYLLTIRSAEGTLGSAPGTDGDDGRATVCGPRYAVAGVALRLVELAPESLGLSLGHDDADQQVLATAGGTEPHPRLRNVLAHVFLDAVARRRSLQDLLTADGGSPSAVELLRSSGQLSDCEVPLALIGWGRGGLTFVDCWAVRRGRQPAPHDGPGQFVDARAREVGIATLQQHAAQVQDLTGQEGGLIALRASDRFRYLPAATVVAMTDGGGLAGISLDRFLDRVAFELGEDVPTRRVWPLLHERLYGHPVDLDRDVVWAHEVSDAEPQPAVVLSGDALVPLAAADGKVGIVVRWLVDGQELGPGEPILMPVIFFTTAVELVIRVTVDGAASLRFGAVLDTAFTSLTLRGNTAGSWTTPADGGTRDFAMVLSGSVPPVALDRPQVHVNVDVLDDSGVRLFGLRSSRTILRR